MLTRKMTLAALIIASGCLAATSGAQDVANDEPSSDAAAASKASYDEGERAFRERNLADAVEGRKVLRLPPISGTKVRTLELQIESLLPEEGAAGGLGSDVVVPDPGQAEGEEPAPAGATASVNPRELQAGAQALMKIELDLVPGTHANSDSPADSALIPTTFFPDSVDGVRWEQVTYPRPTEVIEWYSQDPLPVFEDGAVIQARLTVDKDAGPGELDVSGQLRVQVCDADYCYPPERVPVAAVITVID